MALSEYRGSFLRNACMFAHEEILFASKSKKIFFYTRFQGEAALGELCAMGERASQSRKMPHNLKRQFFEYFGIYSFFALPFPEKLMLAISFSGVKKGKAPATYVVYSGFTSGMEFADEMGQISY